MAPLGRIRIPERFQGPPGRGQGGWTAYQLSRFADGPVTVRLAAPTPLDRDLHVVQSETGVDLVDRTTDPPTTVMQATPRVETFAEVTPVDLKTARDARSRFIFKDGGHPVPRCFSCGAHAESMAVHPGRLDDGRVAVDWRPPDWAIDAQGAVDPGVIWAAMDCASGFYAAADGVHNVSFTAQYAVEIVRPRKPDADYVIVAGPGDFAPHWDGRKRRSLAATFDSDGALYGRAVALWIAVPAGQ